MVIPTVVGKGNLRLRTKWFSWMGASVFDLSVGRKS